MPPLPRARDDVRVGEAGDADRRALAGRRAPQAWRRACRTSPRSPGRPWRVGDLGDAVPVGRVADQVRERASRRCAVGDHLLDAGDVDAVRVGLDSRRTPAPSPPRTIGAMSVENVSAHVTTSAPRREVEQLEREVQRRRARSCTSPRALAEQRRRPGAPSRMTRRPGHSPCGPERSTSTTASISRSSCTLLE